MTVTELIQKLTEMRDLHGDLPVWACVVDNEVKGVSALTPEGDDWEPGGPAADEIFLES